MDSSTAISHKLIEQICRVCVIDAQLLSHATALDDIGLDSIALSLVLRAIEVEFAIEFDEEDVVEFLGATTIGEYAQILRQALERNASRA